MIKPVGAKLLAATANWPQDWSREAADLPAGASIRDALKPFLSHLVASGLAATTLRRHFGNAFLLGGELIDRLRQDEDLRPLGGRELLLHFVEDDGGPLCRHNDTEESPSACRTHSDRTSSSHGRSGCFPASPSLQPPSPEVSPRRGARSSPVRASAYFPEAG